jgi:transposase-like protein
MVGPKILYSTQPAIAELKASSDLPNNYKLRQVKYLNNGIEGDHRFVKR